ncbi:hypothetical protein ADIS_3184 [Lunatimonas lonarensis]|uniref:Uncharacterized protein n=1 Tax=Lunatimonas lonarensis TaxID=1232681 RepID=R7ZPL0_9BACT|nr:hypothetical protein ADIS_3184 [Lunatimonas lonarensis]
MLLLNIFLYYISWVFSFLIKLHFYGKFKATDALFSLGYTFGRIRAKWHGGASLGCQKPRYG